MEATQRRSESRHRLIWYGEVSIGEGLVKLEGMLEDISAHGVRFKPFGHGNLAEVVRPGQQIEVWLNRLGWVSGVAAWSVKHAVGVHLPDTSIELNRILSG